MSVKVVPYVYTANDGSNGIWPYGTQHFMVCVMMSQVRLYASQPLLYASVDGVEEHLDGAVDHLDVKGPGWLRVAVCATEKVMLSVQDYGISVSGLCYMNVVKATVRRQAFEELRYYPTVQRVLASQYVPSTAACESYGHAVHVTPFGSQSLSEVPCSLVAPVGGVQSGFVKEEYKVLSKSFVEDPSDVLLVFLRGRNTAFGAVCLKTSGVLTVPIRDTRVNGKWAARVSLKPCGTSAVMLPYGVRMLHDGVTYGCDAARVFAVFCGEVSFDILPSEGEYTHADIAPNITYLTSLDTKLARRFRDVLPANSSHARFIGETDASVVLLKPEHACLGKVVSPKLVYIDDPMDDFKATETVRLECETVKRHHALAVGYELEWFTLHSFRYPSQRVVDDNMFSLCGVLQVKSTSSPVMMFGDVWLSLVGSEKENVRFSCRRTRCVDDYILDGGGPSDSDFSDVW